MKLLTLKFILIFIYLISSSSSYAIQELNLKNLVVYKDPIKLEKMIEKIKEIGYNASVTSLNPNGFRSSCSIKEIKQFFD